MHGHPGSVDHGGFHKVDVFVASLAVVGSPFISTKDMKRSTLPASLLHEKIYGFGIAEIFFHRGTGGVNAHLVKENHGATWTKVQKVDVGIGVGDHQSAIDVALFHICESSRSSCLQRQRDKGASQPAVCTVSRQSITGSQAKSTLGFLFGKLDFCLRQ